MFRTNRNSKEWPRVPAESRSYRIRVIESGEGRIKLWDTQTKQNQLVLTNGEITFTPENLPSELFVEGTENSAVLRDLEIILEHVPDGQAPVCSSDSVKLSVTPVVSSFTVTPGVVDFGQHPQTGWWYIITHGEGDNANGAEMNCSVNVTGFAGQGGLVYVQNLSTAAGGAAFVPGSGLAPMTVVYGGEPYADANNNQVYDSGEPYTDQNGNEQYDGAEPFSDENGNGQYDPGEPFEDQNGNGQYDPAEPYADQNGNGQYDAAEPFTDVNSNGQYDSSYPFPLLDAVDNPPPATNIFVAGPGVVVNNIATLSTGDSPQVRFPVADPNLVQTIDILNEFTFFLAWWFVDGSIWTLATVDWDVRFEAVRIPVAGGTTLTLGPNAAVNADPMNRNHDDPVVTPPVANSAGGNYE